MRKIIFMLIAFLLLVGCVQYKDGEPVNKDEPEKEETFDRDGETEEEPEPEEEPSVDEEESGTSDTVTNIAVDEELSFGEFTVKMDDVNVYEEDGKAYADISFDWLNQAGDGEKTFMSISLLDVKQGNSVLEETTGAWDVENNNSSDVYFPNAENGERNVELTYELDNEDDPLTIVFSPLNDFVEEDSQEITIDIK